MADLLTWFREDCHVQMGFWKISDRLSFVIVPWMQSYQYIEARKNCGHFADIFKCIFWNENVWILLKISLKFVPKFRINNIWELFQIMVWHRPGDKPLSAPVMDTLLTTYTYVTQPQWVKHWPQQLGGYGWSWGSLVRGSFDLLKDWYPVVNP